jgi:hypothetical protein
VRGAWELIVACKGSVVVAWRRGRMRARLGGLLAVAAMVGAVGVLWTVAGDGASDDAAAPIDDGGMPGGRDADGGATGPRGTVPAARQLSSSQGPGSAEATGAWSAGEFGAERPGALLANGATTSNGPSVRTSVTTTARPNRGGSPNPSIPATAAPGPSVPPEGTTTTTSDPEAPPPGNDSGAGDAGGLGGLLGGVLDVLGVG